MAAHIITKMLLKEVYVSELKRQNVRSAIEHFENHLTTGKFPPQLLGLLKIPKIQISTIFNNRGERQAGTVWLDHAVNEFCASVLKHYIQQKKAELEVFVKEQSKEVLNVKLTELTDATLAVLDYDKTESTPIYLDAEKLELSSIDYPMCEKALTLARQERMEENAVKKLKLQHKVDSDVTMTDTSPSDIAKTILYEVEKALKKALSKNLKQSTGTSMILSRETLVTPHDGKIPQGSQTEISKSQGEKGLSRKRKRELEEEASAKVTKLLDIAHRTSFNLKCFSSYPEAFFTSLDYVNPKFSILTGTTQFVDSLRAQRNCVFIVPYVILPPWFMQMMSLNRNFILHAQMNPKFVGDSITELCRSIRIGLLFRDKSDNPYNIPRFHAKSLNGNLH